MQALGLIETRGLIAAVESADAMLKAAEVTLLDKTYVGGGLVSIAVTGGVAAVKAAVEAGAAAVKQINEALLVSQHVIPRPSEDLDDLIGQIKPLEKAEAQNAESPAAESPEETGVVDNVAEETVTEEPKTKEQPAGEPTAEAIPAEEPAVEEPAAEKFTEDKETIPLDRDLGEITKETVDELVRQYGPGKTVEALNRLKVVKLRYLAREYGNMKIAGRQISKADKKMLLTEFEEYYRTNS